MSNLFEVVDSLPAGRAGRHDEILDEFLRVNQRFVKLVDTEGIRTNTLSLRANQRGLPVKVHRDGTDIYLERTDIVPDQIR